MSGSILELHNVTRSFDLRGSSPLRRSRTSLHAVDDVTLAVPAGSSYGIAGESGSGKTTLARMILLLDKPTDGAILFEGKDINELDRAGVKWYRSRVQAVFQDATASLSPRMRIRDIIAEPLESQPDAPSRSVVDQRVMSLLTEVALPERTARAFPNQLSGGQRQRVAIARALILKPALIVLDEPVSALDVSIRSQVLNLLLDLREQHGLTYLLIAHDLALLRHVTDRMSVMYRGKVVEEGESELLLTSPRHPYTQALRAAAPGAAPVPAVIPPEEIVSLAVAASSCRFQPRCPIALARCSSEDPPLDVLEDRRRVACFRAEHQPATAQGHNGR